MESDPFAAIREELAKWDAEHTNGDAPSVFVDWVELATATFDEEWLVDGVWPVGKHVALFAGHKTGKSLIALSIAIGIAMGFDAFTGKPISPRDVLYVDKEMTLSDLQDRMFDMGHYSDMLKGEPKRLHYALHPVVPPMDTAAGGQWLLAECQKVGATVGIVDTLARVIRGDEQSNDTYKEFDNHTGALLKRHGIALMRLDHEGHQKGHMRGASSKGDDIDIAYQLEAVDRGLQLNLKLSRIPNLRQTVLLTQHDDPLAFRSGEMAVSFVVGTPERVTELKQLGVPMGLSFRKTQQWLRENGHPVGNNKVLLDAVKYRNERGAIDEFL